MTQAPSVFSVEAEQTVALVKRPAGIVRKRELHKCVELSETVLHFSVARHHQEMVMRIHAPKVEVNEDAPFKDALFGREDFGKSLTAILRNVEENMVIFVNAPWGEGKTTFAKMWTASLRKEHLEAIYFDAYAADYFEDAFVSFSGEILSFVDRKLAEGRGLVERQEFKKTAVEVGRRLAGLAFRVGLRAATAGILDASHVSELKGIGDEVVSGVAEIGANVIEQRIEHYASETDALAKFKQSLARLAKIFREEQDFPLTIVVDELDRCRPDFALNLLERIKHLFEVDGLSFVMLVNRGQIENYIRSVYGSEVDARSYLLKFGNLFVDLPNEPEAMHGTGREEYALSMCRLFGIFEKVGNGDTFMRSVRTLIPHFNLTLRELERVCSTLALYYASLPRNYFTETFLVILLAVLKLKEPVTFAALRGGKLAADDFYRSSGLDELSKRRTEVNPGWYMSLLDYCLMSEDQVKNRSNADDEGFRRWDDWLARYRFERLQVIPFLCRRLERFSLQP